MKKITSLIIILVLGLIIYIPGVKADITPCGSRYANTCTTENNGEDADGNTCRYTGGSCKIVKYACQEGKKHCSCYDANHCPPSPRTDDFGNACHAYKSDNTCITMSEYEAINTDYSDDKTPSFLEDDDVVSCGRIENIPKYLPFTTSLAITILTIISMGMLVIMGTIDLFKGTVSGSDDLIKKNQKAFLGRLTSAIMIFLLVALTKLLIGFIGNITGTTNGIIDCIDLFINNR